MDPVQQLIQQLLSQQGGQQGNMSMPPGLFNSGGAGVSGATGGMAGGEAPAWNAGLPPGFSGRPLGSAPPSLFSMTPAQVMQMISGGSQNSNQNQNSPMVGVGF